MLRLLKLVLLASLTLVSITGRTDDTDIFNQPPGVKSPAPNILFILDNTANWSKASQKWVGSATQGQAELLAIKNFVAGLKQPANVGLMMFSLANKRDGGYLRYGIRDMSVAANNTALQNIVGGINVNAPEEEVDQSSGDYANALYEAWLYLKGSGSWAGMDPLADYPGNLGLANGGGNKITNNLTTSGIGGLSSGYAYKGSANGSAYNSPIGSSGCAHTYIIFIGNNRQGQLPPVPASTDPATTTLAKYPGYSTVSNVQAAWARFLKLRPDLGAGSAAAANGSVTTFTIDAYNAQNNADFTAMMGSVASNGGGDYFQAGSDTALALALNNILNQIQAVNSVFASVSLPVSVSVRGTYLNQVYLGAFRPDANAKPNWVGNLKQYQLAVDATGNVYMADSVGAKVQSNTTGFVNPSVISFWTNPSTFWNPNYYVNSQGVGGSSDSPDGDLVEKGGVGQYLRTAFANNQASRNVYTCTGTCTTGSSLSGTPFSTGNSSIVATMLGLSSGASTEPVINWVRGGNTLADDPLVANPSAPPVYNIRGFAHGDVLHSRPAVINYNRTADDIVVFYGANDGMLHAVKGGQSSAGGTELWSFIPSEHFPKFSRMYNHSPSISSSAPKPYFVDGSSTAYTESDPTTGAVTKAYLFLTMRRGGNFIYALDVTNPATPKLLWKHGASDTGFGELGQTWADLRVARLKANQGNAVVIFGLGYDAAANDTIVQGTATQGRGVMVLDAATGNLVWQAGPAAATGSTGLNVPGMTYAIPSNVAIYDSNRDGYIDRLYAADTGANIWRINIGDASPANWTVTKLASLGGGSAAARKFLYAPDIVPATVLNPTDSLLIGSGDREHPFDTTIQNRYYMIKDDHSLNAVRSTPITEGVAGATTGVAGQLYDATADLMQVGTPAQIAAATLALSTASGWYVTLGAGEKVVSGSTTLSGTVMFTTNTPATAATNSCTGNLGEARYYMMNYLSAASTSDLTGDGGLTAADRYLVLTGGGYAPTPVPVSVQIGGNTYQAAVSGTNVFTPSGPVLGRRYRTYWRGLID